MHFLASLKFENIRS